MLQTDQIAKRIKKFYSPATLENYDDIIDFNHFLKLFPQVDMPGEFEIKEALIKLGFTDKSKIDNDYFVLIN